MTKFSWAPAMAAIVLLSLVRPVLGQQGINWTADLAAAQTAAARDGKLILLHFYSDHCPPCKTLERNVFSRPEIAATISRNYVPVKVHVDSTPQLAKRYHVEAWPTDLIVTSAGLEVYRTVSPQSVAHYTTMLDQVAFQSGVGAARLPDNDRQLGASRPADVSLASGTAPTATVASTGEQATAPGLSPGSPSVGNPYIQRPAPRDRHARPAAGQRAAPGIGLPPSADRLAGMSGPQTAVTPRGPQSESIYADVVQESFPAPAPSAPSRAPATDLNAASMPEQDRSIYDQAPPQLPPPQASYAPSAAPPPPDAQRTSAQFATPQFVTASQAPPMALNGMCPVTILESKKWTKGNVQFGAVHRQRTYLFVSLEAQRRFLADPDRYAPILSGWDPVVFAETRQLVDGKHNIGLLLANGKTVFFTSEESLARFKQAPQAYLAHVSQVTAGGRPPAR